MAGDSGDPKRGCGRTREWASLRLDGELSELERLLLRRHLARCEACRAFAESIATATAVVRSTPAAVPSRRFDPARAPRRRQTARYRLAAVAAVAAAIGAAVGSVVATSGGGSSPAPPAVTEIVQLPPPSPTPTEPSENV